MHGHSLVELAGHDNSAADIMVHSMYILLNYRCVRENMDASRPSEHPPVRGENVKTFRWDHRL